MLLLLAGFETTVNLIGNAVLASSPGPTSGSPSFRSPPAGAAIEETLRWDPPVQRMRWAPMTDLELAGVDVPQGSMVVLYLAGANRDPAAYDDPDRFDLWRTGRVRSTSRSPPAFTTASVPSWPGSRRRWPWSGSSNASPAAARRPTSAAQRNCHPRPRRAGGRNTCAAAAAA